MQQYYNIICYAIGGYFARSYGVGTRKLSLKLKSSCMSISGSYLHFSCNSKASVLLICWIKRRLIGPSWEQYPDLFECKLFNNSCWPYLFQGWIYQQFLAYVGYWGFIMEGVLSLQHNVLLYAVRPTTGVWGTKIWSRLHVTLGFKIVLLTRIWLWRLFALASSDRDLQQTDLYYDAHGMTNLSLGVTTKNGTPEIYETLSTS